MKLPLAIDIADRVADAQANKVEIDIPAQASELVADHPEADATVEDVAEALDDMAPSGSGREGD